MKDVQKQNVAGVNDPTDRPVIEVRSYSYQPSKVNTSVPHPSEELAQLVVRDVTAQTTR